MSVRPEYTPSPAVLEFLVRCYRFVAWEWPHIDRIQVPDEGFEQRFRESCIRDLHDWSISSEREFHLGAGLDTASGVAHEVDIIARQSDHIAIMEIKNRGVDKPGKNDVIVFFAKVFDYLAANPSMLLSDVCLSFMSRSSFDSSGLSACLGLGIHPIAPEIRPLPILVDNAGKMQFELDQGLWISADLHERFEDYCAYLNLLSARLRDTWPDRRCGYHSENSLVLNAVSPIEGSALSAQLRFASNECSELLGEFRSAKVEGGSQR